jgi:hypothetical protein
VRGAKEMWRLSRDAAARLDEERRKYPDGLPPPPVPSDAEILKKIEEAMVQRSSSACSSMEWPPYPNVWGFINTEQTPDAEVIAERIYEALRALGYKVEPHVTDPWAEERDDYDTYGERIPSGGKAFSMLIRWAHGGTTAEGNKQ